MYIYNIFIIFCIIFIISFLLFLFLKLDSSNYAYVYYDNKEVLKIDLSKDDNYKVDGDNGEVLIEVKNNKLRVSKENSSK